MDKEPLVSINITTYNRGHILSRCLNSVLQQNYSNIEIIVVDDCSVDDTQEILRQYSMKQDNIIIVRHDENKGLAASRNTAWRSSAGKYIATIDDDDEWIDPDKLKKQVEIFQHHPKSNLAMVCSSVTLVDKDQKKRDKVIARPRNLTKAILRGNGIIFSPTVLTKKSILEEIGGFDQRTRRGIDSDFYRTCIVQFGYDVYFLNDITAAIHEYGEDRMTPAGSTKKYNDIIHSEFYNLYKYFSAFLRYPSAIIPRAMIILLSFLRKAGIMPQPLRKNLSQQ